MELILLILTYKIIWNPESNSGKLHLSDRSRLKPGANHPKAPLRVLSRIKIIPSPDLDHFWSGVLFDSQYTWSI